MDTKDRIKLIMEDQHMTQQVFADFLGQSPATLSSIFNGRTRPTLNIVDAINTKIPDISIEWLLYGKGEMYNSHPSNGERENNDSGNSSQEPMLNFDTVASQGDISYANMPVGTPNQDFRGQNHNSASAGQGAMGYFPGSGVGSQAIGNNNMSRARDEIRIVEREPRRVTEIRVYYDDQTYETFLPSKS